MLPFAEHILCVDDEQVHRESRCAALESSGYHSVSASTKFAEILLSYQKFDLVVLSVADDWELNRLINLADGADILVLSESTMLADLPSIVAERLHHRRLKRGA